MNFGWWFPVVEAQAGMASNGGVLGIVAHASPIVIFTLLLLLFFSVTTWAIIFIKSRQLGRARRNTIEFLDLFWRAKSLSQVHGQIKAFSSSPVAEIFRVGFAELTKLNKLSSGPSEGASGEGIGMGGLENLRRALHRASRSETSRLTHSLIFLATTGNIAPFIGLFGTVVGIMNAFRGIGLQGSASLATVAPGISEALIATAAGLAAAIPAVIAYNLFLSRIRALEAEMSAFVSDLLNLVERDALRKAQAKQRSEPSRGVVSAG